MPVRRRTAPKRRRDTESDYRAWEVALRSGWDFFGELPLNGIPTDALGRPTDLELARAAWQRHGRRIMAQHIDRETFWGLEQFGEPD